MSPFRRGDVREDGLVFFGYTKKLRQDGTFKEIWLRPAVSERVRGRDRDRKKERRRGDRV